MNAAGLTRPCRSICVTCLSQDRKLFPVNDSKSQASLLVNLSEGDQLCWECHFFVLKVAAFRSRAARAQTLLASALHQTDATKFSSLSSLTITPVYLDINVQTCDVAQDNVKTENIKEENENILYECPTEIISSSNVAGDSGYSQGMLVATWLPVYNNNRQTEAKRDESCGEAMGGNLANASWKTLLSKRSTLRSMRPLTNKYEDDITIEMEPIEVVRENVAKRESINMFNRWDDSSEGTSDDLIPVSNEQIEAKGDERVFGGAICDDIANASLKTLLSRKSTISISPLAMNSKKQPEVEFIEDVTKQKDAMEIETESNAIDPESIYSVTILSEEEMLKWRERKKDLPYYATKAAALKCSLCIEPFNNMRMYVAHARRHTKDYGPFECRICGVHSVSEKKLGLHTAHHYRLLTCKLCGYEWDSPNGLRAHCSAAHAVPVTQWECDQCARKFQSCVLLAKHVLTHRVGYCHCGAIVAQGLFPRHLRLHNECPIATCTVCGKEFKNKERLAIHMKNHDPKVDEAAYCAECNMQFRTMGQYRVHVRYTLKHARSDFRPHKCDDCGKAFLTRTSLVYHRDSTHSVESRHTCSVCGEKFKTRTARNGHERRVHKQPNPRHICDYCGKVFLAKNTLVGHLNSHTGARPYKCLQCDATFGHKSALYLHGRYKHKIKKKTDAK